MRAHAPLLRALGIVVRVSVTLSLCGLLLLPAALQSMSHNKFARPDAITGTADNARLRFVVKGRAKGLWPGERKVLRLRINNPNASAIRVLSLSVRTKKSDKPGCSARWIKTGETKRLSVKVPPRSRGVALYPVSLRKKAPNACQGARWPLRFTGTARRLP